MSDLTQLTIAEIRDGLAAKSFSAVELTKAYLAAMEKARSLNAYIVETPEKALAMAAESDKRIASGEARALEGVPLGIKDLFATEGIHTQAASHVLDSFKPTYESTVTANLWADGAVMLGKLNMDEFAMGSSNETSYYGPVVNPWRSHNSNAPLVPGGALPAARRPRRLRRGSAVRAPPRPIPAARSPPARGVHWQPSV